MVQSPELGVSYVFFLSGSTYFTKNGTTGEIDYSGPNAATVLQNAIDTLAASSAGGGKILVREGEYSINTTIALKSGIVIEGCGKTTVFVPIANVDVFRINAAKNNVEIRSLKIWDKNSNQNSTAGIKFDNYDANSSIWHTKIISVEIRNCFDGILTRVPTVYELGRSVVHSLFRDIYICNIRNQALFFVCFFDDVFENIVIDLATIPSSLLVDNVVFGNGGQASGTWISKLKILGSRGAISSNNGVSIDNVASIWLYECFIDTCGWNGVVLKNSLQESRLTACTVTNCGSDGINWWGSCSGRIYLYNVNSLGNTGYGFFSNTGDASTKYIIGGASIGNTIGPVMLPTGTNYIKHLQGYTNENSGISTGAGTQQTVSHGLNGTPNRVFLSDEDSGANPYQSAPADGTNIYITATNTKKYQWKAEIV